ncbi:MAG: DUF2621 family protein [Candidatus Susulua stagnicola]|nr:DUF2621 family protein [Candidatus Susulua stagnicola]
MGIIWNQETKNKFNNITENLPQFHRTIAEQLIKQKSEELAEARNSKEVEDKDLIIAFFQEVPPAFKSMLERLLSKLGIDYSQYISQEK